MDCTHIHYQNRKKKKERKKGGMNQFVICFVKYWMTTLRKSKINLKMDQYLCISISFDMSNKLKSFRKEARRIVATNYD